MPIDYSRYPTNWHEISEYIRFDRAGGRCECEGECGLHEGRCEAEHGKPHPVTGSRVVLTTAHRDDDVNNNDPENLFAACQRCHLVYDKNLHAEHAQETRRAKAAAALAESGQVAMFTAQEVPVVKPRKEFVMPICPTSGKPVHLCLCPDCPIPF